MNFRAQLNDFQFLLTQVINVDDHLKALGHTELNGELVSAILDEGARFAGEIAAPLNREGDEQGAQFDNGAVTTPPGFVEAYHSYCEQGWAAMTGPEAFGGQQLPALVASPFHEMLMSANLSFRIYSGLTEGVVLALRHHANEQLKNRYLPKLVSGEWAGTMCLTEPQAGTDLALLRTKAEPAADRYRITGTKIFISGGEQDLTDNIVHLVLARLPDAPAGVKGISLFLVPKRLENGNANAVSCGSIEHKMGIRGAATCVMNFDAAEGYLVGDANQGLACMFTMMNDARFQVGLQGLGIASAAATGAQRYAVERLQCRALSGTKSPAQPADPILVHGDVRRMLLTQKSLVEGGRLLALKTAQALDLSEQDAQQAARAALLIPIMKAFLTDMSMEVSNLGVQIFGGHGYIREWGMEQLVRDGRITQLYEGTNGIQALDLVRRKLLGDNGQALADLIDEIARDCERLHAYETLRPLATQLAHWLPLWHTQAEKLRQCANDQPDALSLNACDFLHFCAYLLLAWCWLLQAEAAGAMLDDKAENTDFLQAKIICAQFYFERILPRNQSLLQMLQNPGHTVFRFPDSQFAEA
ncbi:acyl-CoA dehydrogenase C-terminal domain-containing protein [Simiduia agarivorans]|uniref:3-methylmercaptopropionyl-CoA dehydrogenase n=1 Tax=Simiduia agarivorans (strain DSM 21679 / JCM 13881 / BCRC 17597 / SA1) TaxID=1117647 RepID=K4KQ41_SIMAS|nr:acyl-CoA dehydrogenase C-terminal domain-containing protein [Simiduia agarivorans]AFV00386.1 acyl-CoA dehydrogenase domain-containing protein [Simiduia agarivorans SA1 = DSM 21679]